MTKDITKLPVKNKREGERDLFLVKPPYDACGHYQGPFEVDEDAGKCVCKACGGEVTPMFVLMAMLHKESRWMTTHERHKDEMKRLAERSRTTCDHCGKMTRISGS